MAGPGADSWINAIYSSLCPEAYPIKRDDILPVKSLGNSSNQPCARGGGAVSRIYATSHRAFLRLLAVKYFVPWEECALVVAIAPQPLTAFSSTVGALHADPGSLGCIVTGLEPRLKTSTALIAEPPDISHHIPATPAVGREKVRREERSTVTARTVILPLVFVDARPKLAEPRRARQPEGSHCS